MDHDRLFKELLTTFFVDFIELFFPDLAANLDRDSVEFLDKEIFTDVTHGDRHEADIVAKARFQGKELAFLIHVEPQARHEDDFARRMFTYCARLLEKYGIPVYPIALFTFPTPRTQEPSEYKIEFPDLMVLTFKFRVVQLNRLAWRDFLDRTNPIAAALMANMAMQAGRKAAGQTGLPGDAGAVATRSGAKTVDLRLYRSVFAAYNGAEAGVRRGTATTCTPREGGRHGNRHELDGRGDGEGLGTGLGTGAKASTASIAKEVGRS